MDTDSGLAAGAWAENSRFYSSPIGWGPTESASSFDDDAIKDLAVSLRPRGVAAHEIPAFVDMIVSIVRIEAMNWRYDVETGRWVNKANGAVDDRQGGGVAQIAAAGRMNITTGSARPKPGDLKPSDSLVRDLEKKALEPMLRQREEARARLEQLDRDIEAGKVRFAEGARIGDAVAVPTPNGGSVIVPESSLSESDKALLRARREAAVEKAYPSEPVVEREPRDIDGLTASERAMMHKHLSETAATERCIVSNAPDPEALQPKRDPGVSMAAMLSHDPAAFKCIPNPYGR